MKNNEDIKNTDTSVEIPAFKKNSLFNPNLDFDDTLGFIPFNEFE